MIIKGALLGSVIRILPQCKCKHLCSPENETWSGAQGIICAKEAYSKVTGIFILKLSVKGSRVAMQEDSGRV